MPTGAVQVAVVGAGIAGLTVAGALRRAGMRCVVYERAALLTEVGAGLQLAPNAAVQLHRLGLRDYLDRVAVRPAAIEMLRWDDGRLIMRTPLGAACVDEFGAPYYTVHRAQLQQGLLDLLEPGTVQLGQQLAAVRETTDGVEMEFVDGARATADLLVGADGIHSVVRDQLRRDEPRYSRQAIHRGLVPAADLPELAGAPAVRLWLGPGQHCVAYPIAAGHLISFAATTAVSTWRTESWVAPGHAADLAGAYRGWHPHVGALIRAAVTLTRWGLHDRAATPRWSTARTTLVGDAAHPMLPFLAQGANQAIEDAVALVACLRSAASVPEALRRYEELRVPRTTEVHRRSRASTGMLHLPDGDEQRSRDHRLAADADLRTQQWLYGYDAELAASGRP